MTKIMVADDSAFMRKILVNILNKEGYKDIIEVANGKEAVEKYKKDKPDLVSLDIIMDKEDGITALKDIIRIDNNAKVVMVSAVGQEQMVKEALGLGAKDFIAKPFDAEKIIEKIKKLLD